MELRIIVTQKGKIFEGKAPEIINSNLTDAMYEATQFFENKIKAILEQLGPKFYFTGLSRQSIHGEVQGKGTSVVKGIVGHQSKYGDIIFGKGRTAGKTWPPEGVLLRWIEVKLGVSESEARRLEFIIRRKIGQKGFAGSEVFERGLKEGWTGAQEIFDRRGFEIARQISE